MNSITKLSFLLVTNTENFELTKRCVVSIQKNCTIEFEIVIILQVISFEKVNDFAIFKNVFIFQVSTRSLSESRKFGIDKCSGNWIHFIDDDASLIDCPSRVIDFTQDYSFYSGRIVDFENITNNYSLRQNRRSCDLNKYNLSLVLSSGLIFKNADFISNLIDVKFGVGSQFGSSEETDFCLQLLNLGYKGKFVYEYLIGHPANNIAYWSVNQMKKKFYSYGLGRGAFLRKNIFKFNILYIIFDFFIRIFMVLIFYRKKKFYKHLYFLKGMLKGFIAYEE